LVEFVSQIDEGAQAARRERWGKGPSKASAATSSSLLGDTGASKTTALLVTGARLRLWEKYKASAGRSFGSAASEAGALTLFLEAVAAKEKAAKKEEARARGSSAKGYQANGQALGRAAAAAVGADESSGVASAVGTEASDLARAAAGKRMPTAEELTAWGRWKADNGGVEQ